MKYLNSKIKLKSVGFIVLLALSTLTYAQSPNGPTSIGYSLESCYHLLTPSNTNNTLNVLNVGAFNFKFSNNAGARPDHIRIKMFDDNGNFIGYNYHEIGLADDVFTVTQHPDHGVLVSVVGFDVVNAKWVINQNKMLFPENATTVEITAYHWTGDAGNQTLDPNNFKLRFNLFKAEDAFTLEPWEDDCFTFDNFNMRYTHILDGFCGSLSNPIITLIPPPPSGSGWNEDFTQQVFFNTLTNINQPHWQGGVSWCDDACMDATAPHYITNPVTCGCVDFEVKVMLEPCPTGPADCPPVEIVLPLKICCDCDVRETAPQN